MSDSRSNIFEGRSLEEAVNKGLAALRLSRAEAMITVMQEGSSGFLGFGSRPFRVRMTARPGGAIREEETREPRRVRGERGRPERGGRGGRDRGGRGGREERGGRDRGERAGGGDRAARGGGQAGRGDRRERGGEERRGRAPREERRPEERRPEERREEPVAQGGEARPREEHRERAERGGRGGRRGRRGDRGPREARRERGPEQEPMAANDDHSNDRPEDRQPRFGMRGFEDRRRPGDRREEGGSPPAGSDERRSGEERRGEMSGPRDEGDGGRRRRRGRRGGRRRHRDEGAVAEPMTGAMPMTPMGSDNEPAPPREVPMEEPESESFAGEPGNGNEEVAGEGAVRGYDRPRRRDRDDRRERRDRDDRREREPREPALTGEQLQALTRQVTEDLMRAMGFDATVTITPEDDEKMNVTVQVPEGEEFLTGRKGETRQALQHLLNRMVNRGEGSRYHIQLEINDFWAQREKELEQQARQMADDAVSTGNEQVTDYLNAQERRIIHVTLREDSRVRTYAIGDGMIKRLAVAPAHAETTEPLE